jgi:hypothetical protein
MTEKASKKAFSFTRQEQKELERNFGAHSQSMTMAQQILDFDLYFMQKAFSLVDSQLKMVDKYMTEDFQTEGDSALVDDWEYLHAIGFVTAQKYLTSSCKVLGMEEEKPKAFAVGPRFNPDVSYAAVVNAVANHWKHSDEWNFEKLSGLAKGTIRTIEKTGLEVPQYGAYVASNVFQKMGLKKFADLTAILKQWSDDVEAAFPRP